MIDTKLNTLLKVSETMSFTRAAEELSFSQPAVSGHIRQLEAELNTRIFVRGDKGLKLTKEGEITLKYAKRIASLYANLEQEIEDEKRRTESIAVGVTHTAESNPVAEVLARCGSMNSGLRIKIITDTITNLYDMLKNYEIDLAVVEGKLSDPSFSSLLLDTDFLVLVVSNNNHLAKKSMVTLNELKKEKMILRLPNSGTRNLFISHIESQNMRIEDFDVVLEVDNIATIKDLIRRDFGVSILARSACLDELKKGKLKALPVENLSMIREINLVYHRDFEHMDVLRDITKMYNETVKLYQ